VRPIPLIGDQQYAMCITNFTDSFVVTLRRGLSAQRRTNHWFRDKCHNSLWTQSLDFRVQEVRHAKREISFALTFILQTIRVGRVDVIDLYQQRRKRCATSSVATGCQRAKSVAVIARLAGNDVAAFWLAVFNAILTGQFKRGFHRLGTRPKIHNATSACSLWRTGNQMRGQIFGGLIGE
jgi:hypothetical protein